MWAERRTDGLATLQPRMLKLSFAFCQPALGRASSRACAGALTNTLLFHAMQPYEVGTRYDQTCLPNMTNSQRESYILQVGFALQLLRMHVARAAVGLILAAP